MKQVKQAVLAASFCSLMIAGALQSQAEEITGYIAVGGMYAPDYEGSSTNEFSAIGAGRIQYGPYYINSNELGFNANFSPLNSFEFGLSTYSRQSRNDDVGNDAVSRLREIDATVEMGAFFRVKTNGLLQPPDELSFEVDALWDVSSTHDGMVVRISSSYDFSPTQRLRLGSRLIAVWASDEFNETYFNIDTDNALRSGLMEYDAEGGLKNVNLVFSANYMLTDR